ncbi:MAG: 8-amino-7-oxononanoate synthase, partial [Cyanobacteria bacterium K_DeepCast_35m_m2_155]|nr:8-amino-7-oxononanoate synthase [Cyanobacteria bacterium K_DeepCast_35m_m2_155]
MGASASGSSAPAGHWRQELQRQLAGLPEPRRRALRSFEPADAAAALRTSAAAPLLDLA